MRKSRHQYDRIAHRYRRLRDRRELPRYEPREARAWLSWRERDGGCVVAAWLLEIGQGGAALTADEAPPPGRQVCVRLAEDAGSDWLPAKVVAVSRRWRGPHLVRLAFRDDCPWDVFKAALFGVGILDRAPPPDEPAEFADSRHWR